MQQRPIYVRYLSFSLWQNSVEDEALIGLDSAVVECLAIGPENDATTVAPIASTYVQYRARVCA